MSIRTKFDTEKAMEAILYIAKRVKIPTFHTISKIFYFADQIHILKYGRFITGDQ
jgi:ABC-type branched-subunit amino acid transport system ATPase component